MERGQGVRFVPRDDGAHYIIPPLTDITCPVMYDASSEQRNRTTFATSSGLPILPMGMMFLIISTGASLIMSVSMSPGATTFTRIPFFAISDAMDRLAASALPVTSAEPVGFTRGDATLAAYQITLNEI